MQRALAVGFLTPRERHERVMKLGDAAAEERVDCPPDRLSWPDVGALIRADPVRGMALWTDVKQAAVDEWRSGHRSAAIFKFEDKPWQRAQFLAVRSSLVEAVKPANGLEATLVELLSQSVALTLFWVERHTALCSANSRIERGNGQKGLAGSAGIAVSIRRAIRPDGREFTRLTLRIHRDLDNLRHNSTSVTIAQLNVRGTASKQRTRPGNGHVGNGPRMRATSPRTGRGHRGDQNCHRSAELDKEYGMGGIGHPLLGWHRYLNQLGRRDRLVTTSQKWQQTRSNMMQMSDSNSKLLVLTSFTRMCYHIEADCTTAPRSKPSSSEAFWRHPHGLVRPLIRWTAGRRS